MSGAERAERATPRRASTRDRRRWCLVIICLGGAPWWWQKHTAVYAGWCMSAPPRQDHDNDDDYITPTRHKPHNRGKIPRHTISSSSSLSPNLPPPSLSVFHPDKLAKLFISFLFLFIVYRDRDSRLPHYANLRSERALLLHGK